LEVLKDLLGHDRDHVNLPLAVLFARSYSWDILGVKTADGGRKTVEADGMTVPAGKDVPETGSGDESAAHAESTDDPPLASEKVQVRFKNILNRYLEDVKTHAVRDQRALAAQSRRNAEAYVKSGEIFEDRQSNFEKQSKAQERLVANTQVLCEILGIDMPDLAEKDATDSAYSGSIGLVKTGEYLRGQGEGPGIWEDEEERRFYENLVDLKGKVPAVLLEDSKKKKGDGDDQAKKKADGEAANGVVTDLTGKTDGTKQSQVAETNGQETDEHSTAMANKTMGAQVDALLAKLPELQTKDSVDQLALEFCFLNSKASRNRLVKAIQEVPKGRSDLLPLYARLVATLGQYMPDITQGLISYLDEEFRSLQRRKQKEFLGQVRTSNIRYLAELTKFGVVPEHVIFHCFKVSLDDFSRMNIEIIGNLLENCGRYLLRNPETSPRMTSFLETLGRKKTAQHLGQQERMIIENAMYYVDPPQRPAIQQKERTPMELFVRKLVYLDMNKRNYTKVLKSIRKLHWEEPDVSVSPIFFRCEGVY
jgi:regulator of nonsense transcripts 2